MNIPPSFGQHKYCSKNKAGLWELVHNHSCLGVLLACFSVYPSINRGFHCRGSFTCFLSDCFFLGGGANPGGGGWGTRINPAGALFSVLVVEWFSKRGTLKWMAFVWSPLKEPPNGPSLKDAPELWSCVAAPSLPAQSATSCGLPQPGDSGTDWVKHIC